jgi:hypothetical protein
MNEELTNEALEAMKECNLFCPSCSANGVCSKHDGKDTFQALATALLEERAKPKVWDGAPEWADRANVSYNGNVNSNINISVYTRELPKTRTRQIAENIVHGINGGATGKDIEYVEGVLKRYAEELEGKE